MQDRIAELRELVTANDANLQRSFAFEVEEIRDSGAASGAYSIKGHAAVYNKWSLDLGGFRERVADGAFDEVLSRDPHVLHLWDHDMSKALSSTRSNKFKLELGSDDNGLKFYSRVAPTSYSQDLRMLLEGGVIDQSSFAFTVAKDEWKITEDDGEERVERTILEVAELFDVTTCAMGAYPTTDSALALRTRVQKLAEPKAVVQQEADSAAPTVGGDTPDAAPDEGTRDDAADLAAREALKTLKRQTAADVRSALRRFHRGKDDEQ